MEFFLAPPGISSRRTVELFCRTEVDPVLQWGLSFVVGVLFSPWSTGIFYLLIGILVYEILLGILAASYSLPYPSLTRVGVIGASILGFLVGRELFQQDILEEGW